MSTQTIVVFVIALIIGFVLYKTSKSPKPLPEAVGIGKEGRVSGTVAKLQELNDFKEETKSQMSVTEYRKQLMKKVRQFERNRGVRIIRSTLFSEGPILLNEF